MKIDYVYVEHIDACNYIRVNMNTAQVERAGVYGPSPRLDGQSLLTIKTRVQEIMCDHPNYRAAAVALGLDHSYLYRLGRGEKFEPTKDVLDKLGLERITLYTKKAKP